MTVLSDVSERLQRGSGRRGRKRKGGYKATTKNKKKPKKRREIDKTILD